VAQRWRRLRAMTPARLGSTQARQPPDMAPHPYLAWAQRCDDLHTPCVELLVSKHSLAQPTNLTCQITKKSLAWLGLALLATTRALADAEWDAKRRACSSRVGPCCCSLVVAGRMQVLMSNRFFFFFAQASSALVWLPSLTTRGHSRSHGWHALHAPAKLVTGTTSASHCVKSHAVGCCGALVVYVAVAQATFVCVRSERRCCLSSSTDD
jgi:hypothetical protein